MQKTVDKTGALTAQYQYTTGKNGERTKTQEEGPAGKKETEYEYDGAGRLTGERTVSADSTGKETETSYAYEYDNAGNRTRKKTSTAGTTTVTDYTYNSRNQLAEEETKGRKTQYHYDANGNLLKKSGAAAEENAPGKIVYGEFKVADYLPDRGSPKANWKQNSGILRSVIREGVPIKDVSEYPMQNAGFLGAERNLLEMMGWAYDDGYWYLP